MDFGWLSLIPPVVAIGLALWTRQVFLSLLAGIWVGFVILAGGNPFTGTLSTLEGLVKVFADAGNTRIILFTLIVGALIALLQKSGGVEGFVGAVVRGLERQSEKANARGQRRRVELLALLTGFVLFIESNISILTVGTLYRPLFDKLGIPREKMALIADTGSAPSCILIPINAWGAYIAGLLALQSVANPMGVVFGSIAFNFYPILITLLILFVILSGKDFGEMKRAEIRARETGKLLRDGAEPMMAGDITIETPKDGTPARQINMWIPLIVMVALVPLFILYTGWEGGLQDDGSRPIMQVFRAGSGSSAVLWAVSFATLTAALLYKAQGILRIRESAELTLKAMGGMVPLAVLMVFAFALGQLCKDLGTGIFVAEQAKAFLSPALVPAIVFITACFIAFSTGTSWGTFAIMLAIAVPLAQGVGLPLPLVVAAALGGGIFGDHCSPISDTSIISSMASASDHIDHIRTQLPYALLAGGVASLSYLIAGFVVA